MTHPDLAKAVRLLAASRVNEMVLEGISGVQSASQRKHRAYRMARSLSGLSRYQFNKFVSRIDRSKMNELVVSIGMKYYGGNHG